MNNPFSVTKASEYTDKQIDQFWVKMVGEQVLNPRDFTPRYILGSKGCGKTHLLRYYSFPLQKLRHGSFSDILAADKYIGIYSILSTIDVGRFDGKGVTSDQWSAIFQYYFELYIAAFVLKTLSDFFSSENGKTKEEDFVKGVAALFLNNVSLPSYKAASLIDYVESQRKEIDLAIENVAFTEGFKHVVINLKSGSLIFGIPELMRDLYDEFNDVEFIYIMDEYEKLFGWQKRYINSLVWEKKHPSTFWIGARKYGYTDMHTMTGEKLKVGSEYSPFIMDEYYQKDEKAFEVFAKQLISNRLYSANLYSYDELLASFQTGSEEVINSIILTKKGKYKHLAVFENSLKSAINNGQFSDKMEDLPELVEMLKFETADNPLEQKYKLFMFYQIWASHKMSCFRQILKAVNDEYQNYKSGKESKFKNIIEKFKSDFVAQLCEENNVEYYASSGLTEYIKLSWGNPRVLLVLLKNTIEKAQVLLENPLKGGQISFRAQYRGIKETSRWYLDDSDLIGESGGHINTAINNLGKYLRLHRFSDKPIETSASAFNFGTEDISHKAAEYIKLMELHSLLVKIDNDRKQRNSGKAETTYQLNRILAPNWNLSSARRGVVDFSNNVIESIFNPDRFKLFDEEYVLLKNRLNAPFSKKDAQMGGLF